MKFDKFALSGLIFIIVLIIFVPLGLLAQGTAYGEWSINDIQSMIGYVPSGLQQLSGLWNPPLPDYDFGGEHTTVTELAPGYYISAIVGVILVFVVMYLVAIILARRNEGSQNSQK